MRNFPCNICGRGYSPSPRFQFSGIGISFLMCVRELKANNGNRTGNLQERLAASYNDLYIIYNICRAGHKVCSNLYGKAGMMSQVFSELVYPDSYRLKEISLGRINWDKLETDIVEIGVLLDFEISSNVSGANCDDRGYESLSDEDSSYYLDKWKKKAKEVGVEV